MAYLRKRPRQERARATFEAIVEAGARILVEEGPEKMTTNAIAARAGVSVGSLYQYFPNRAAIVRALMERELTRAEALRPAVLDDPSRPARERVRAAVDWHFDVHAARPDLSRALHRLLPQALPREERRRLDRLRTARTAAMVSSLRTSAAVDLDSAALIVETCLAALAEAAIARRPALLRSPRWRDEVTALLAGYLER